jgi:hypothetical protein
MICYNSCEICGDIPEVCGYFESKYNLEEYFKAFYKYQELKKNLESLIGQQCPVCGAYMRDIYNQGYIPKHKPDCWLAAELKEVG